MEPPSPPKDGLEAVPAFVGLIIRLCLEGTSNVSMPEPWLPMLALPSARLGISACSISRLPPSLCKSPPRSPPEGRY